MTFHQLSSSRVSSTDDGGRKYFCKCESKATPGYKTALINRRSSHSRSTRERKGPLDRPELISNIHKKLNFHRQFRTLYADDGTSCPLNIHKNFQKLIRTCFEQKIQQSKLYPVGDLFLELFTCSGNSFAIFSILVDSHMISTSHDFWAGENILYPRNLSAKDHRLAFQYYLDNVSNLRDEEYEWNNGKRIDLLNIEIETGFGLTPLLAAVQKRDPALLLIVLRYGADPFLNFQDENDENGPGPIEQLIDDLNGVFLFKNTGFSAETRSKLAAEEVKLWLCLTYVRRAVTSIPITSSSHVNTGADDDVEDENGDVRAVEDTKVRKTVSLHPNIAEKLDMNYFSPTMSLKHACRCTVRASIKNNSTRMMSLPAAISQLPLPNTLKAYLDLLSD